jgi:ZIP family zinc transporter
MIPESHRKGFEREATFGLIAGFVIMMALDCIIT